MGSRGRLRGDPQRGARASPVGRAAVRTTSATCPVSGSSRAIVRAASFATQTASPLAARATGLAPTGTVDADLVGAGIDPRDGAVEGVRHPDRARADGDGGRARCRRRSSASRPLVSGSTRTTRFAALSLTHAAPRPTAMPRPAAPTSIVAGTRPDDRIDPRDGLVVGVGDPDRALSERDRRRAVPNANRLSHELVRVGVDTRDGSVESVRHPDVAPGDRDPGWTVADRDRLPELARARRRCGTRCSSGSSSPRSRLHRRPRGWAWECLRLRPRSRRSTDR